MKLLDIVNGKNFVGGNWVSSSEQIDVINPSNNNKIGSVPRLNEEAINKAVEATVDGFNKWSKTSVAERVEFLKNWHELILKNLDELAHIISTEQGKVNSDAKGEIKYGASFIDWYAHMLPSLEGSIKNGNNQSHKIIVEYEPVGPTAAITPWNFPVAMITRKLAPALAAGCSMLLKPSELTPLSALAIAKLAEDAGLPGGAMNVITGRSSLIGKIICESPKIRKLSFTGSTSVGKLLYRESADTLKKLSLELGGNAPFIIFKDADLAKTAYDLIVAKTRSNGQSCISPNRIFIHNEIYDEFVAILKDKFLSLRVGDALSADSDIGPLINKDAIDKILALLKDAEQKGAKVLGGNAHGNFLSPTILIDLTTEMDIFKTEIFGPVLACYQFATFDEVIKLANDTEYGLQAYVYSNDLGLAQRVATNLDFGMVSINSPLPSNSAAPFGGRKYSGFGVEGGKQGIFEYLNTKYINLNLT
jgi:succinate-semialdehyde dehydrogenase / glutarate-semialdehyde dehydrogenase